MNARTTTPSTHEQNISVAVIGLGYVGLPLALLADECGYAVTGFDIDTKKIAAIREKKVDFISTEEQEMLTNSSLTVSDKEDVIADHDIYVVCVPTPVHDDLEPDLRPLRSACASIGRMLRKGALIIIESTVSPSVCEKIALREIEQRSGLRGGIDFSFAHCPERVNPGDSTWTVRTIPRVIGADDAKSLARAMHFYESILDGEIYPLGSIKEAEAVKMVENSFRDINIAFVNELAMSFQKAGIDLMNVLEGASTKPFGFVPHVPGCGVGGHCIPVDPYYLIRYGRENGFEHHFLITARRINSGMPRYTVSLLEKTLREQGRELEGATIALLGLAYKSGIPDMRESPALEIREELQRRGAIVSAYDPYIPSESDVESVQEAFACADAAVIATDHEPFRALTPAVLQKHNVDVLIDGRNCLPKESFLAAGIQYRGIGC